MNTVYKVVYVDDDGRLWSFIKGLGFGLQNYVVHYIPGVTAFPPIGKLIAFDDLDAAISLTSSEYGVKLQVWRCTTTSEPEPCRVLSGINAGKFERFWAGWLEGWAKINAPEHSVMVDDLTLVELIHDHIPEEEAQ